MHDKRIERKKDPNSRSLSCGRIAIPLFAILILLFALFGPSTGDPTLSMLLVFIALSIIFILPAGALARFVFRGKFGELIRGEPIDHEIVSTKRFKFSLRENKRPFWVTALLFVLGWIIMIAIIIYMV
jgi:Na+/proline symporter